LKSDLFSVTLQFLLLPESQKHPIRLGGNLFMRPNQNPEEEHSLPRVFEYRLPQDWQVLAGRTDEDNDNLSLRMAAPNDWWFHVKGQPGSHVVLRVPSGREPDRRILKQAAAIAAYHSKARHGGVVPVSATRARYVSKPRGAKPGTVQIRKEIVLKVRPALPPEEP
jgi:predicted ribosome quality control (RQC) complex YloA/Tae2 family protein